MLSQAVCIFPLRPSGPQVLCASMFAVDVCNLFQTLDTPAMDFVDVVGDLHFCGRCESQFSLIISFIEHRNTGCVVVAGKHLNEVSLPGSH